MRVTVPYIPALFSLARRAALSTSGERLPSSGSMFTIAHRTSRIVTATAGASSPSRKVSTPPTHSSSSKGDGTGGSDNDIRTKSPDICAPPSESADLANCIGGDHGDARLVENTVLQLHHLHVGTVAPPDLCG